MINKSKLIDSVAKRTGLTKVAAGKALAAVVDNVIEAVKSGEQVRIAGFGTFSLVRIQARKARNPLTGESIMVPQKNAVRFTPTTTLVTVVQNPPRKR